jgi:hypothetical protein
MSDYPTPRDRLILRELAHRVAEIAALPIMAERRRMWRLHHRLQRVRPMVLVFPEGSWRELLPEAGMLCEGQEARQIEWRLRSRIYHHEHLHDDTVIEGTWTVNKQVTTTGWGLEPQHVPSTQATGAWGFDPVILGLDDLKKLHYPEVIYDTEGSAKDLERMQDLFGDVLSVRPKGVAHISFHLMQIYCQLRGLAQVMWDMYDNPAMLHEAMAFLQEGNRRLVQQYIDLNLLSLNNDDTYHSSGGMGYTDELPLPDYDPARIRPCDMWSSAEAQEMAQVSPEMHSEFILQYEKPLLEPFGLNGYGCCEDLTSKLDDVFTIPHLRRISISPFANVDRCAEKLGHRFIYSWKPHPAHLVGDFDAAKVRGYIKHTLDVTRDCVIEMILKDTHTCENHPERFTRWTDIAQRLVEEY